MSQMDIPGESDIPHEYFRRISHTGLRSGVDIRILVETLGEHATRYISRMDSHLGYLSLDVKIPRRYYI